VGLVDFLEGIAEGFVALASDLLGDEAKYSLLIIRKEVDAPDSIVHGGIAQWDDGLGCTLDIDLTVSLFVALFRTTVFLLSF
jgi:hypothetical protein